ncbi:M48 family metallopeptidase [Halomonas sp. MCCC 1A17488]|uniref:M48 family metallopeptidase n=1 Tax=unclassified Halomonas TaxID=2609666 RepID=UPI0018D263C8|nr:MULTISPECIES: M48 family metallopeptidase [unclassified Halomonas]MCE8018253.1 M48 family metallopeptidase [Halomonas sp. MCCC 1A17488]MCG3241586.1 M48 family metallopeptidase [Halomonas sp. MCCC 1A17488]QPP48466.1 M48 family metallopeptidase [Halomonas sp. SS10-MC5]
MDFFGAQARAKRLTAWLVVLLVVAVLGMIVAAVAVIALAMLLLDGGPPGAEPLARALDPRLLGAVALGVLLVVAAGSLARHLQLRSGGAAVAEALGGRIINAATHDADERRLLNVVEEMAIASGLPVPAVYLLDEPGINAFAAGHTPQDAVIGVTRGAIRCLSRDELQGVVAHEFSHVLHGDMRLNLRLVALLYGILVIGLVGRLLLRGMAARRVVRSSRRGSGHAVLLGAGLALMLVGFVGTLCGNLIKAAVSRQREFLADASAVQYTRNPAGLADALKRVAAHAHGSELRASRAEEFSHFYFSRGLPGLRGLTATHPPLSTRIRRLEPGWDGKLPEPSVEREPAGTTDASAEPTQARPTETEAWEGAVLGPAALMQRVGQPREQDLQQARGALAGIAPVLLEAAHDPYAARAVIYGVLMGAHPASRNRQRRVLDEAALPGVLAELTRLEPSLAGIRPGPRLPLIELCLPLLRQLSVAQHARFRDCLERLMAAEDEPGALQWALHRLIVAGSEGGAPRRGRRLPLERIEAPLARLLSSLAQAGSQGEAQAVEAFRQAADALGLGLTFEPRPATPQELDWALDRCRQLSDDDRLRLLDAMVQCVAQDGRIHAEEAELLRAVAWSLDCPLPMAGLG